jgi:uncharacterized protein
MNNLFSKMKTYFLFLIFSFAISFSNTCFSQENNQADYIKLTFMNEGSNISGIFFKANKEQPVPTAILLQGFPGRDGDIKGIGSFLKNEGVNAFVFNYRGTWKSEGFFSVDNAISDVIKAVKFLSGPEISEKYNIDINNIVIIGYSWGGGIMFLTGKSCPSVKKFISLGTTDLKIIADRFEADTNYKHQNLDMMKKLMESKIIRGEMTGEEAQKWMITHKDEIDLSKTVDLLFNKKILFIGGWNDEMVLVEKHIIPLYRSFKEKNPSGCKLILFDSDHSFNNVIPELHKSILDWIKLE